jgi:hypothetical protein
MFAKPAADRVPAEKNAETVAIPMPPKGFSLESMDASTTIEIDEIREKRGHFSVDYRVC